MLLLARRIGLNTHRCPFQVVGISLETTKVHGATRCRVTSRYDPTVLFMKRL